MLRKNKIITIASVLSLSFCLVANRIVAEQTIGAYDIKAAFLLNFIRFTYWPSSFESNEGPFNVVVVGDKDVFASFRELAFHSVRKHPIEVARMGCEAAEGNSDVAPEVIFIAKTYSSCCASIMKRYGAGNVLLVSDIEGFVDKGGMIELVQKGDNIHFMINLKTAGRAGLEMNYQLLKLADRVVQ
jgi:hypothetical protein